MDEKQGPPKSSMLVKKTRNMLNSTNASPNSHEITQRLYYYKKKCS